MFPSLESLKTMSVALLTVGILILSSVYEIRVGILKKERDVARNELSQLTFQVKEQNTAIEQWKAQADAKDKEKQLLLKKIKLNQIKSKKDVMAIMATEVPPGCEDAAKWAEIQAERMGIE